MKIMKHKKNLALGGALLALTGLMACNISSDVQVGGNGGGGLVVSFTDTTEVMINFDNLTRTVFAESADFDLDEIRQKLRDNEMDSNTVSITHIEAGLSDSTVGFLLSNANVDYVFQVLTRDPATTAAAKLTLESSANPAYILSFDPTAPPMELNNQLFGNALGFSDLMDAIKGTASSIRAIAQLSLVSGPLNSMGIVKVKLVLTVSGKKKV